MIDYDEIFDMDVMFFVLLILLIDDGSIDFGVMKIVVILFGEMLVWKDDLYFVVIKSMVVLWMMVDVIGL